MMKMVLYCATVYLTSFVNISESVDLTLNQSQNNIDPGLLQYYLQRLNW